jgi:hypothetical protein
MRSLRNIFFVTSLHPSVKNSLAVALIANHLASVLIFVINKVITSIDHNQIFWHDLGNVQMLAAHVTTGLPLAQLHVPSLSGVTWLHVRQLTSGILDPWQTAKYEQNLHRQSLGSSANLSGGNAENTTFSALLISKLGLRLV